MTIVTAPRSLRSLIDGGRINAALDTDTSRKVTIGCLMAIASIGGAKAEDQTLPPVKVEAPVERKRPPAAKPSPEQLRVRAALRRAARAKQARGGQGEGRGGRRRRRRPPTADPYADPAAPYKADRLARRNSASRSPIRRRPSPS